eukprot:537667-Rhodomonas_salina.2
MGRTILPAGTQLGPNSRALAGVDQETGDASLSSELVRAGIPAVSAPVAVAGHTAECCDPWAVMRALPAPGPELCHGWCPDPVGPYLIHRISWRALGFRSSSAGRSRRMHQPRRRRRARRRRGERAPA